MKTRLTRFEKAIIIFSLIAIAIVSVQYYRTSKKIDDLNARIKELVEMGYSIQASKKIASSEFGFIPLDEEYNALIED